MGPEAHSAGAGSGGAGSQDVGRGSPGKGEAHQCQGWGKREGGTGRRKRRLRENIACLKSHTRCSPPRGSTPGSLGSGPRAWLVGKEHLVQESGHRNPVCLEGCHWAFGRRTVACDHLIHTHQLSPWHLPPSCSSCLCGVQSEGPERGVLGSLELCL